MDKFSLLNRIKQLYTESNINIMEFLKQENDENSNDIADILISYDFQAGTYIKDFLERQQFYYDYLKPLSNIIDEISDNCKSMLDCGTGEGSILIPLLKMIKHRFDHVGGCDISWSRIKNAQIFSKSFYNGGGMTDFIVGDMCCLPCGNNSFDVVFTHHAIEPNGGREKQILSELYRVANKYLVLVEPAYELIDNSKIRKRMEEHGYIKNLYGSAKELGLNVITWRLYDNCVSELNPPGLMIIKKNDDRDSKLGEWSCPLTKTRLEKYSEGYYSKESLLAYPIIGGVPLLTRDNAVVATKFTDLCIDKK